MGFPAACHDMLSESGRGDARTMKPASVVNCDRLSHFVTAMRDGGLAATECGGLNQFISRMLIALENLKHIYE